MVEKEVLGCEARPRLEQVDEQNSNQMEKRQHCPMMRRFSSSRESGRTKFLEGTGGDQRAKFIAERTGLPL
jgi:hypothetical protein